MTNDRGTGIAIETNSGRKSSAARVSINGIMFAVEVSPQGIRME